MKLPTGVGTIQQLRTSPVVYVLLHFNRTMILASAQRSGTFFKVSCTIMLARLNVYTNQLQLTGKVDHTDHLVTVPWVLAGHMDATWPAAPFHKNWSGMWQRAQGVKSTQVPHRAHPGPDLTQGLCRVFRGSRHHGIGSGSGWHHSRSDLFWIAHSDWNMGYLEARSVSSCLRSLTNSLGNREVTSPPVCFFETRATITPLRNAMGEQKFSVSTLKEEIWFDWTEADNARYLSSPSR